MIVRVTAYGSYVVYLLWGDVITLTNGKMPDSLLLAVGRQKIGSFLPFIGSPANQRANTMMKKHGPPLP
jgi:hypothetical protein